MCLAGLVLHGSCHNPSVVREVLSRIKRQVDSLDRGSQVWDETGTGWEVRQTPVTYPLYVSGSENDFYIIKVAIGQSGKVAVTATTKPEL